MAKRVLAIDPGKRDYSWAVFDGEDLVGCGFVEFPDLNRLLTPELQAIAATIDFVVCEGQQIYGRGTNPNDLLPLANTVGALIAMIRKPYVIVLPRTWTNGVKKEVRQATFDRKLLTKLVGTVTKSKEHNVIDAVMLGKWSLNKDLTTQTTKPKLRTPRARSVSGQGASAPSGKKKAARNRSTKGGNVSSTKGTKRTSKELVRPSAGAARNSRERTQRTTRKPPQRADA